MSEDSNTKKEKNIIKNINREHYTHEFDKECDVSSKSSGDNVKISGTSGLMGLSGRLRDSGITGILGTSGSTSTSVSLGLSGLSDRSGLFGLGVKSDDIIFAKKYPDYLEKNKELNEIYEQTINKLINEINDLKEKVALANTNSEEQANTNRKLEETEKQLKKQIQLGFLLRGVNQNAQTILIKSDKFQKDFLENDICNAFVMAVDIRRSTELMSKARSPQKFADFMTTLCRDLEIVIKENYGVFDKFTGDGVLAFFPDFYSGEDAGFYVIYVADLCHKIFEEKYREFRSSFTSVLTEVGLGIGIDYGTSHLVQIAGGLTVVGAPVVYACRMSGAPAATTLLNQPGYEKICEKYSTHCFFQETEIEIKNEGKMLAYKVQLNGKEYSPSLPQWTI